METKLKDYYFSEDLQKLFNVSRNTLIVLQKQYLMPRPIIKSKHLWEKEKIDEWYNIYKKLKTKKNTFAGIF